MATKLAAEIAGLEYDWLASDTDGHIGLFSTAGAGYAPEEFLRDTDAHDVAIEELLATPPRTVTRYAPDLPAGKHNMWRLMAERGLFAFDCSPNGGPYRLVAAPETPVSLGELPELVAAVGPHCGIAALIHSTSRSAGHPFRSRGPAPQPLRPTQIPHSWPIVSVLRCSMALTAASR